MRFSVAAGLSLVLFAFGVSVFAKEVRSTVVYDDVATALNADPGSEQLWIDTNDLARATRFELKPKGVCRDDLCFPLPKGQQTKFVRKASGKTSFNLKAFAELVHQPVAHDDALATWYFGLRSDQKQGLTSLQAPNFTLPDVSGKPHSLSDFRGKKILLVTWASW